MEELFGDVCFDIITPGRIEIGHNLISSMSLIVCIWIVFQLFLVATIFEAGLVVILNPVKLFLRAWILWYHIFNHCWDLLQALGYHKLLTLSRSLKIPGYYNIIGACTCVLVLPFAKCIIEKLGNINIIYAAIITECGRLTLFSLIK